jgi:cytochrome c556
VKVRAPFKEHMPWDANGMLALSKIHGQLYAVGSETAATSPAIWSNSEAFAVAVKGFENSAQDLTSAVEQGNRHHIFNRLTQLGENCESCYGQFRTGSG